MNNLNKKLVIVVLILLIIAILSVIFAINKGNDNFGEEKNTTEDQAIEIKNDKIVVDLPKPNEQVTSPVKISGKARGIWFFEASFPVIVKDSNGKVVGQAAAHAKGEWMTAEFVPFEAEVNYDLNENISSKEGKIILKKDNPSGLPENDDSVEIPVKFK